MSTMRQVTTTEGFGKTRLFEILGGLEEKTRPLMLEARKLLAEKHGEDALQPWNTGYVLSGDIEKKMVIDLLSCPLKPTIL